MEVERNGEGEEGETGCTGKRTGDLARRGRERFVLDGSCMKRRARGPTMIGGEGGYRGDGKGQRGEQEGPQPSAIRAHKGPLRRRALRVRSSSLSLSFFLSPRGDPARGNRIAFYVRMLGYFSTRYVCYSIRVPPFSSYTFARGGIFSRGPRIFDNPVPRGLDRCPY